MIALRDYVLALRASGLDVPDFDPLDGGTEARVAVLLETPGPKAVSTRMVSRSNPDPTARNMAKVLDDAGFQRTDVILWNVVPNYLSTIDRNRRAKLAQVRGAIEHTNALLSILPSLRAVILCGRVTQAAAPLLRLPPGVVVAETFHTGNQAFNQQTCRTHTIETFRKVAAIIGR